MTDVIEVFTDGSTTVVRDSNEIRYGGIAVFFHDDCEFNTSKSVKGKDVSNQFAELKACELAITAVKRLLKSKNQKIKNTKITIYSDSMYVINSVTVWAKTWEKNDWKRITNGKQQDICHLDVIKKLYRATNFSTQRIKNEMDS